jgi:hypothetical protein
MTKLPTIAVRNALAAIALTGDTFPHTSLDTRIALHGLAVYNHVDVDAIIAGRSYRARSLTAEGAALLEHAPLWKAAQFLIAKGYRLASRCHKPGFVRFIHASETKASGMPLTAFIASGRDVYEDLDDGRSGATRTFPVAKGG